MFKVFEKLLRWTSGMMAATALFAIMWLTLFDVTGRKFFNNSIPGSLEITEILMVLVIFGALPLVSWRSEHVVFDTLDPYIPAWLKSLQGRLVHLICAVTLTLMAYLLSMRAGRFAEYGDVTIHLQLPLSPVAWLMSALLMVTALIHLLFAVLAPLTGQAQAQEARP